MSFANQDLVVEYLRTRGQGLASEVHPAPAEIDGEVARLKLAAMDLIIDHLTPEQRTYLSSWREGA